MNTCIARSLMGRFFQAIKQGAELKSALGVVYNWEHFTQGLDKNSPARDSYK